jgi:hypothetical protein
MITKKINSIYVNNKTKHIKSRHTKSRHTKKNINNIKDKINKAELFILINIITNHIIVLLNKKQSKSKIKPQIIKLLKEIRKNDKLINKNTTDKELTVLFNAFYKQSKIIYENKQTKQNKNDTQNKTKTKIKTTTKLNKGGFYFKNIEDKGDQPITGNDMAQLLNEMQDFFYNAQWTDEGQFLRDPNTLLSMMRGDTDAFKGYLTWRVLPKYIQWFPPFIKWDAVKKIFSEKKYEDLPDYLLAYQTYMRSQDEYLVEKGLKSPDVLKKDLYTGFYNKLANKMDENIMKYQQFRNKLKGKGPVFTVT